MEIFVKKATQSGYQQYILVQKRRFLVVGWLGKDLRKQTVLLIVLLYMIVVVL